MPDQPVFTFCHLRKTGGITFTQILRREFGLKHLDGITRYPDGKNIYRGKDLQLDRWIYPSIRSLAGHGVRPFLDYGDFADQMRWLTILRSPSERYVSHFIHHVEHFGYDESFRTWMQIEQHQNDQTKTIAGVANIELAKKLLNEFYWVGFTEDYNESMLMLEGAPGCSFSTEYSKPSNVAKNLKFDKKQLLREYTDEVAERNQLDQELYDFARDQIWTRQKKWLSDATPSRPAPKSKGVLPNRLKRNFVYKPFLRLSRVFGRS